MKGTLMVAILLVCIAFGSVDRVFAQTSGVPFVICKRNVASSKVQQSEISLRMYPLGVTTKRISNGGVTLLRTIEAEDLIAIQAGALINQITKPGKESLQDPIHTYARQSTPDTILISRGRQILVFPRSLLLYPKFANLLLQPNDFVASVHMRDSDNDILREFLSREARNALNESEKIEVSFGSIITNQYMRLQLEKQTIKRFSVDRKFFSIDEENKRRLESLCIVNVVRRSVDGYELSWICPTQAVGSMGESGSVWRSMHPTKDAEIPSGRWDPIFGSHNIDLKNGDRVEISPIDAVSIF